MPSSSAPPLQPTPATKTKTHFRTASNLRIVTDPSASTLTPHATRYSSEVPPSPTPDLLTAARVDISFADAVGASSTRFYAEEAIQMDPITPTSQGHRRRRSSLMNPANSTHRPRQSSCHNPTGFQQEEPKISEEGLEDGRSRRRSRSRARTEDSFSDEDLHDDEETGLTDKAKRRKQKKRRRNTLLDQRIVKDNVTEDEKKLANQTVVRKLTINGILICLWYLFSLGISLYNKWMFDSSRLNFPFPLFTTSLHMLMQFTLASLVLYFVPSLRPHNSPAYRASLVQSRHGSEEDKPIMSKMFYLTRIGPCGAATGLDIGLGNTSLKFITLTFYTMCKSSSLAFVLIFAFMFRLETPTMKLVAIIATMTAGVVMMVAGEVEFKLSGFILVISAAFFSGFRWGLTQILLLRNPATSNPFSSIFFLAPVMFVTLTCIAIPVEGFWELMAGFKGLYEEWGVLAPFLILFPGTIAFLMTASEFALLQRTSVVTLSIAGIFKEVVTISTATLVFDDKLTTINISGLFVTLGAICAYNWIKISKMREDAQVEYSRNNMAGETTSPSSSSSTDVETDGEEAGLLGRQSSDMLDDDNFVLTTDGDIIPKPQASPASASTDGTAAGEQQQPHQRQD